MSLIGAISRTRPLLGPKREIPLAMTKWWKKKSPAEGEIRMHLSMNEQHAITPWIKTFPKKVLQRFPTYLWPAGTVAFIYSIIVFSKSLDYEEDLDHRF